MRIRSTKPEFWRSERVASVDWEDRFVLKGLESYVDDNGVGKDDLALIVGDLFQRDLVREPSRTIARVSEAISRLNSAGLVWRYEVDGTALLYVSFWESIQRVDKPQAGRFPRPDGTMNYKDSAIRECVANPRESSRTFAPGTGEQGNRGTGEQGVFARDARDARASRQRRQPNFGEMVRGEPDPAPDAPHTDTAVRPVAVTTTRQTAERLVKAVSAGHPTAVVRELVNQTNALLLDDQPEQLVGAALQLWSQKGLHPKALPALVSEVIASSKAKPAANAGIGKPTQKALGHELAGAQLLAEMGYEK